MTETPLSWNEFLAEPPEVRSPHWFTVTYARLLALELAKPEGEPSPFPDRTDRLTWGRDPALPDPTAVGSSRPRIVLVGESAVEGRSVFFSRSGHWLLRGIRAAGYDEGEVLLTNACEAGARKRAGKVRTEILAELRKWTGIGATWIALGRRSAEVCRAAGIRALEVAHPQWHARFKNAEGPDGYARIMIRAGLNPGPFRGTMLPGVPHPDERTALADRFDLAPDVAFRRGRPSAEEASRGEQPQVHVSKREEARRLYVTGEVLTLKAAAERVKASYRDLGDIARDERWSEQRDQHARETTDRAIADSKRAEAKAIANTRKLSWAAAQIALKSVVERMQQKSADGEPILLPEIREAVALTTAAKQMADLETPTLNLDDRPEAELVAEAKRLLAELEGDLE